MRVVIASFTIALAATAAFAQDEAARKAAAEVAARVPVERAATGAPYSADTLVEGIQLLADGNRIVRKTTGRVYRDGEGRTRREEDGKGRTAVSIVDPVAGFSYSLDAENKVAWRTPIAVGGAILNKIEASLLDEINKTLAERARGSAIAAARSAEDTRSAEARSVAEQKLAEEKKMAAAGRHEPGPAGREVRLRTPSGEMAAAYAPNPGPLEHKTLEGIAVEGRKTTMTIPAGQVGNEQPLTIVSEEWHSPELNILVMTHHSDPRTGDSTYRLTNIVRAEPDRSLFMVPPDYTVKETGIRRMVEASQRK